MVQGDSTTRRGVFSAKVRSNRRIGTRFYKLLLEFLGDGARAFANCRPGQFAQLDLSGSALPAPEAIPEELADSAKRKILLRRPYSFSDVTVKGETTFVEILYRTLGPASLRMSGLSAGDCVSVLGPLGRGFWVPEGKSKAVLVSGGMGAGPLVHLAKVLTESYSTIEVVAFAGAKTAEDLPFERRLDEISQGLGFSVAEFARYGIESFLATDDGSTGYSGTVTDCFSDWLKSCETRADDMVIYGCGPEPMLAKIAEIAREKDIDCQLSLERRMACGIGLCQSCVVECRGERPGRTIYKLCCEDGPVFDSREVIFG